MKFQGIRVAVVPPRALGDATLYLRLAWLFHREGAVVDFFSDILHPARAFFDWLQIEPLEPGGLPSLAARHDLVISHFNHLPVEITAREHCLALRNIAFVTAKKLPQSLALQGREVMVGEHCFQGASTALCLDTKAGLSMVQWIDRYAQAVFGIAPDDCASMLTAVEAAAPASERVVIFPTTPHASKNYSMGGFRRLAQRLARRGWRVEFVCLPREVVAVQARFPGFPVYSFADTKGLISHLLGAACVISNDSGGGHLASLLGLRTFTITRKHERFVWRPGFNAQNRVLTPLLRIKWFGRYIWRPFVPVWRIVDALGVPMAADVALQPDEAR